MNFGGKTTRCKVLRSTGMLQRVNCRAMHGLHVMLSHHADGHSYLFETRTSSVVRNKGCRRYTLTSKTTTMVVNTSHGKNGAARIPEVKRDSAIELGRHLQKSKSAGVNVTKPGSRYHEHDNPRNHVFFNPIIHVLQIP